MGSLFARGNRLYAKIKDVNGKWQQVPTGLPVGKEPEALKWIAAEEKAVLAARTKLGPSGPLTVNEYAERWLTRRKTKTVKDDRARITLHVLPVIGHMPIGDVRPRHLRDLIVDLKASGKLAPKTIREVAGVVHTMFKSAVVEEIIVTNPAIYERGVLPKKVDKDPTWRAEAIFTRAEVEKILSDPRTPLDRRVVYALKFFTGRHTEVLSRTWSAYDTTRKPLGALNLSDTKSGVPRAVPVHRELAKMLEHWRKHGYRETYGRDPKPTDLIVTTRAGRQRKADETQKQFRRDLDALGLRTRAGKARWRRGHDLRRTLITLAREDGAPDHLLRWVTHGPKAHEILDVYSTPGWKSLCDAVSKLRIRVRLGADLVQSRKTVARAGFVAVYERPRRDSNRLPLSCGDARCKSNHDDRAGRASPDIRFTTLLHQGLVQCS